MYQIISKKIMYIYQIRYISKFNKIKLKKSDNYLLNYSQSNSHRRTRFHSEKSAGLFTLLPRFTHILDLCNFKKNQKPSFLLSSQWKSLDRVQMNYLKFFKAVDFT